MRTARQSGWSLSEDRGLIIAYSDYGDYLEIWANVDGEIRQSQHDFFWQDLPRSVLSLISLWLDVQIPSAREV